MSSREHKIRMDIILIVYLKAEVNNIRNYVMNDLICCALVYRSD